MSAPESLDLTAAAAYVVAVADVYPQVARNTALTLWATLHGFDTDDHGLREALDHARTLVLADAPTIAITPPF